MKWFNSDSKLLFNIVFALIIGIIFGNFLGNSMLKNQAIYANAYNYSDEVYLLQSGVFYDSTSAENSLTALKALGLDGLVVKEGTKYYVYHGISYDSHTFDAQTKILTAHGVDYLIKLDRMYYMLTGKDNTSAEYSFYYDSINLYLSLLHNKTVTMTTDYTAQVTTTTLELYNNLNTLNQNLQSTNAMKYNLFVYQSFAELLI